VRPLSDATLWGGLLALPTVISLDLKGLPRANTLVYYRLLKITDIKSFISFSPRAKVIELFTVIINKCS
jgi:hypothetical protein